MIFGKIEYLNLLPFHVFMKRYARSSQQRHILNYKRGVPSAINKSFKTRRIDAAFISSISSKNCKCTNLGILARKEVKSVLLIPGKHKNDTESAISSISSKNCKCTNLGILARKEVKSVLLIPGKHNNDTESATSNVLARVLKQEGKVIIGDKALKYFLDSDNNAIDLAKLWYQEHKLPFVFARLCYHGKTKYYHRLSKKFLASPQKIPFYLLQKASSSTGIKASDILDYLQLIEYKIDSPAELSLKRFLHLANTSS